MKPTKNFKCLNLYVSDGNYLPEFTIRCSDISDGYHTMDELYDHRMMLFVALLNNVKKVCYVFKSKLHHDGTMFEGGWFIAGIMQKDMCYISYHLKLDPYWNLLDCFEMDRAPEWDGHTSNDVLERLKSL